MKHTLGYRDRRGCPYPDMPWRPSDCVGFPSPYICCIRKDVHDQNDCDWGDSISAPLNAITFTDGPYYNEIYDPALD